MRGVGKCRITGPARDDLRGIRDYIASDNRIAAARMLDRLSSAILRLGEMPGIGRERDELAPGLRSFTVAPYLIIYRDDQDRVEILRVVHGSQDYERLFS